MTQLTDSYRIPTTHKLVSPTFKTLTGGIGWVFIGGDQHLIYTLDKADDGTWWLTERELIDRVLHIVSQTEHYVNEQQFKHSRRALALSLTRPIREHKQRMGGYRVTWKQAHDDLADQLLGKVTV